MAINQTDLDRFLDNPSVYYGYSATRLLSVPDAERDELHFAGLRRRFGQLRDALPMLQRLADSQNVSAINQIEDVVPLLFDHATYKSYPVSLLDNHRYDKLTMWFNKLTTHDLSQLDVSKCRSIDDWMLTLRRETPMAPCHTSGSTGTISFLPMAKSEYRRAFSQWLVQFFQPFGAPGPLVKPNPPLNLHCIYPSFRDGGSATVGGNNYFIEFIAGSEERFHAAYPGYQSADLMRLAALRRAAAARGTLDQLKISPDLVARRDEFEAMQRNMPAHSAAFFKEMCTQLAGERVFMMAIAALLYPLAEAGLKQGIRNLFSPDSVVVSGGGAKNIVLPDDWEDTVKQFLGIERLHTSYGMSEGCGTVMSSCELGHYHCMPNVVPFVLDPNTNQPLPRKGRVTGRFAFYDLIPDTHWGGFITGDEVTMEWSEPCPCGRGRPYIVGKIQRYTDKSADAGEEKINCAATPAAYNEALEFLNAETH